MCIRSDAKLKWYLRVLDKRPEGYHNIETVFQQLDLADTLAFEPLDTNTIRLVGFPDDIAPETNLVTRAWQLLKEQHPTLVGGLQVTVEKIIPRGGGLGGGSSNAAVTLLALNQLYNLSLTSHELESLAAKLGSDAPFFIRGGVAIACGRGELLTPLAPCPQYHLLFVFPPHGISTRKAYDRLDRLACPATDNDLGYLTRALASGDPQTLAGAIHNDFERVLSQESWFTNTVSTLDQLGCHRAFLCGSGSTVAALGKNNQHCREMSDRLRDILPYAHCITCTLAGREAQLR
jgi:4-diphosphocytidyl-2C-methyl-D-erythritol kinase